MKPARPANLVALLSDFGLSDGYVGSMKAAVLAANPRARLVDITHAIPPGDVLEAAFLLRCVFQDYPPGTVFLAVVDPGVGSARRPLALKAGGWFFVGPDNGLFCLAFEQAISKAATRQRFRVVELQSKLYFRKNISATFHGRDIFGPCAGALSRGVALEKLGQPIHDYAGLNYSGPRPGKRAIFGRIMRVDSFGNLVSDINREDAALFFVAAFVGAAPALRVQVGRWRMAIAPHYAGQPTNRPFAVWGSSGFLEISANRASAADLLRLRKGAQVRLFSPPGT